MVCVEGKSEKIQDIVDMVNLSDISSIKRSITAIIRVTNNPKSTVKELKEVILLDPPMATKVLRTANSAYYSRSFTSIFSDIEQSIIWFGKTFNELFPDTKKHFLEDDLEVMQTGEPVLNVTGFIETRKGVRQVLTNKIPYKDINGKIIGIICFALDVTDLRRAEKEKRDLSATWPVE